ncbi:GYF domain containing protein [Fasciola gigantica]|uniref:GYF domain containing protein n=1 Tax=Fasciola gigantica TaxID=46835 RepID=A0A504YXU6_FASGI|nr:GYF domain containing protein [Fasciola gigantica]
MKAVYPINDGSVMHFEDSKSTRKRYSREVVLSLKEISANMKFPVVSIPVRAPRTARKTSQSNDQKGQRTQEGSREDLDTEELDGSLSWHRVGRGQWHSGSSLQQQPFQPSNHSRQRYPSGPHGDTDSTVPSTTNAPLRTAPDTRRGGHGDWSRGCAGWRQRSYSGSERPSVVVGQHPRGRGSGTVLGTESEDSHSRGRGRGRGITSGAGVGRFTLSHRGGGVGRSMHSSTTGSHKTENSEEFWHDEDWEPIGVESGPSSKSRERLNSFTHSDLPPVAEQCGPRVESEQLIEGISSLRVYSKSCSLEPPPGFSIPPPIQLSSTGIPVTEPAACASKSHSNTVTESLLTSNMGSVISEEIKSGSVSQTPGVSALIPSAFKWYYVDSVGKIQGPFGNLQMSGWMAAGFLPLGIELRRDCDECFLTLADHMNLAGRVPFWDGYSLKPLTRSNVAALAQALSASTGDSFGKLRWISGGSLEGRSASSIPAASTAPLIPHFTTPSVVGPSTTAVAAAAAATAVLFATATQQAARIVSSERPQSLQQQQQQPTFPMTSTVVTVPDTLTVGTVSNTTVSSSSSLPPAQNPVDLINGNQEFMRLYTEAQALAAHAAKVEAERKELVEKLAAINSTAAKLLTSVPAADFPLVRGTKMVPLPVGLAASPSPGWLMPETDIQSTFPGPCRMEAACDDQLTKRPSISVPDSGKTESMGSLDAQLPTQQIPSGETDAEATDLPGELASNEPQSVSDSVAPDSQNDSCIVGGEVNSKKSSRKKNKKPKKKMTVEQERQLAWEAEFERRKQAALQRKLAEEAEVRRLAEEEAAAIAEERTAAAQEQARLLMEQRKREAQRAKADSQLEQLRLPQSARWGTGVVSSSQVVHDSQMGSSSLLSIQAAQALEEAEQKRCEALLAEQMAVQLAASEASAATKRPQAWAAFVNSDARTVKPVGKIPSTRLVTVAGSAITPNAPSKAELLTLKAPEHSDRHKTELSGGPGNQSPKATTPYVTTNTAKSGAASTAAISSGTYTSSGTSIWDLPSDGKVDGAAVKSSKKQKKKHGNLSREAASFAAREELAHWCESQLSSMPLSGVDLPTLVDLLCELEAADQVVEFIENSLGRSKRISKFSKAFLEKRAFILNTVP